MSKRSISICLVWGLVAAMVTGCGKPDRLVVYADPWLSPFPEKAMAAFKEEHPGLETELRLLSSEVIAQHLHFGQPVDVFLCFDPRILRETGQGASVASEVVLAPVDMVFAEIDPSIRNVKLGADTCIVVAASGRPLRRLTEEWVAPPQDTCIVYGDFCRQTQDYMLRGWVSGGYVPGFFARRHPDRMRILRQGPVFPGAFAAIKLLEAPHPDQAAIFMDFLGSEKCKTLLAEEKIIP